MTTEKQVRPKKRSARPAPPSNQIQLKNHQYVTLIVAAMGSYPDQILSVNGGITCCKCAKKNEIVLVCYFEVHLTICSFQFDFVQWSDNSTGKQDHQANRHFPDISEDRSQQFVA